MDTTATFLPAPTESLDMQAELEAELEAVLPSSATTAADALPAGAAPRIRVWDLPTRLFHWLLVAAVSVAVVTGWAGGDWMPVHGLAGLAILGLVSFRLAWGFVGSTHSRFAHFAPTPARLAAYLRGRWQGVGHNPLGGLSVFVLLALLAAQAVTGLFGNDDIAFAGPLAGRVDDSLSHWLTGVHHQLANVLLAFLALHVVAIVFHALVKKDDLLRPMVTGYKVTRLGGSTRGGGWIALGSALCAAVAAVALATGILFAPRAVVPANGAVAARGRAAPAPPLTLNPRQDKLTEKMSPSW